MAKCICICIVRCICTCVCDDRYRSSIFMDPHQAIKLSTGVYPYRYRGGGDSKGRPTSAKVNTTLGDHQ